MGDVYQKIRLGDCVPVMKKHMVGKLPVDVIVTSPPYNIDVDYNSYKDNISRKKYLSWMRTVFKTLYKVLKEDGSLFLNVGFSSSDPWIAMHVAAIAEQLHPKPFVLQNQIVWIKSLTVAQRSYGHFKPINSNRFINNNFEMIFHFTKTGNVFVDKLSLGVPYEHKSNLSRWQSSDGTDKRCRGNCWFIPYETVQQRGEKGHHPAIFPTKLAEWCIKLHGIKEGMLVLDPFCGTGSTLVAAKQLGVSAEGIELDKEYYKTSKIGLSQVVEPIADV